MRNYQTKSNLSALPDTITATRFGSGEFNSIAAELENAVSTSDQTLAPADGTGEVTDQLAMALAIYGSGGASYHVDTGAINAYVLNPVSPKTSPPTYFDGFMVLFEPATPNSTASTVNVASLGLKSITLQDGSALTGGELAGTCAIKYNLSDDRFEVVFTSAGVVLLGNEYVIDATQADQGAASTNPDTYTIFDVATLVGTTKNATIHLEHNPNAGNETLFNFDTSLDLSTYPNLFFKIDAGAKFTRTTGDETLKVFRTANLFVSSDQQLTSVDMIEFSNRGGVVYPEWWGAVPDSTTDCTNAIQYAINQAQAKFIDVLFTGFSYKVTDTINVTSNGISLSGLSGRISSIMHSGDYGDTFYFSSSTPLTSRITFLNIKNLRIYTDSSAADPTSGAHMHFNRPQTMQIENCVITDGFGGMLFEGGNSVFISDTQVNSGTLYAAQEAGSYLVKFESASTSGSNEAPGEYFIKGFNWRDSGNSYIQYGLVVEASDGLFFSNGHVGFTYDDAALINPTVATDSLNGLNFTNVHFDGNSVTNRGVRYYAAAAFHTGACFGHTFTGCQFSICASAGVWFDLDSVTGIEIAGGRCNANGTFGMRISSGLGFIIKGVNFNDNGADASGNAHILIEDATTDVIIDCIFTGTAYRGVQITGTANRLSIDGIFNGITLDDVSSASTNFDNRISGITTRSNSIASAATLLLPLVGDVFQITGTTGITSITGSARFVGRVVRLIFEDALTVTDGGTLLLAGNFTTTANDSLTLVYNGTAWVELSRSVN